MFIKIKIVQHSNQKHKKYIVDLIPQFQPTILHFKERLIQLCEFSNITPNEVQIQENGYFLPNLLSSAFLSQQKEYLVHITKNANWKKDRKILKAKLKKISSASFQSQKQSQEESQEQSEQLDCEENQDGSKKKYVKKSKNKKQQSSSQSFDESSESSQMPRLKIKNKGNKGNSTNNLKTTKLSEKKKPILNSQSSSEQSSEIVKQDTKKINLPSKNMAINKQKKIMKVSSSDEEEEEEGLKPRKVIPEIKQSQKPEKNQKKMKTKRIMIKQSQQSSDSSPFLPPKQTYNETKPIKIPISVRNRQKEQSKFENNQQAQWIPITKSILQNWHKKNPQHNIIMSGNQIRFKITDLDEEKFIPVLSDWITGNVEQTKGLHNDSIIYLQKCTLKKGDQSQFHKKYDIPFLNIQELQIKKITLKQQQKIVVLQQEQGSHNTQQKKEDHKNEESKQKQSIESYICGQINYYFSDKNYSTDLFMMMHANKDPNKYIDCSLMLNFPKIKKVLTDANKLWRYLIEDEKLEGRNYELDVERKMLRKKIQQ